MKMAQTQDLRILMHYESEDGKDISASLGSSMLKLSLGSIAYRGYQDPEQCLEM